MVACISILVTLVVAMVGREIELTPDRQILVTQQQNFYIAFVAVTNPVLAYAEHLVHPHSFCRLSSHELPERVRQHHKCSQ
ncbi:hypothetical protein K431DRAFT_129311 [Polychaeton citri CBS 116435]|uniref:Secreted protein n=1 Tax=Polychaeton citri CBS 116435 TaxID=1314669 RepID=A0A9P4Q2M6_9PEZI|nr:hypothetical protein K431DRAFT_129311 [Polychaeton citri CBS 116435]